MHRNASPLAEQVSHTFSRLKGYRASGNAERERLLVWAINIRTCWETKNCNELQSIARLVDFNCVVMQLIAPCNRSFSLTHLLWHQLSHLLFRIIMKELSAIVAEHYLISTNLRKDVKVSGIVPRTGGQRENLDVSDSHCPVLNLGHNCASIPCAILGCSREYAIVRNPEVKGIVYLRDMTVPVSNLITTPEDCIVCDILAKEVL